MAQLTVYIDEETLERIGRAAETAGCSVSKWVKRQVVASLDDTWPEGYFAVLGSLADADIERPPQSVLCNDVARESL